MANKKDKSQTTPNHPLFELTGFHHRAVELRYEGKTYKEITGIIGVEFRKGVHPDTVKKWFGKNGLLQAEYLQFAREENDRRRQLMREELKKLVPQIPTKLQELMNRVDQGGKPDMVSLMAVKTLIEVLGITADDDKQSNDRVAEYFDNLKRAAEGKAPVPLTSHGKPA